jgi:hypothetical protein
MGGLSVNVLEWRDQQVRRRVREADDRLVMGQAERRRERRYLRMGAGQRAESAEQVAARAA